MPEKDDAELPDQAPAADIPDLKKKEEERKKSGAAWGTAKQVRAPLGGATAEEGAFGARAAASVARAAASAARAAGAGAAAAAVPEAGVGFLAQITAIFSDMTATLLGKAALMAAAALVAGCFSAVAYRVLYHGRGSSGNLFADLGAIASTVRVSRATGDSGLRYTSQSGLLQSADLAPGSNEKSGDANAGSQGADSDKLTETSSSPELRNGMPIDRMAHDLSGSKLSAATGGRSLGSNIPEGGGAMGGAKAPKIGASAGQLAQFGQQSAKSGKGGALQAKNLQMGMGMNHKHLSSTSRTLALLRGMSTRYNPAIRSGGARATEVNAAAASSQFESSELNGGATPASATASAGAGAGGGGGAVSAGNSGAYTPTVDSPQCDYEAGAYWNGSACVTQNQNGANVTPWQGMVNACTAMVVIAGVLLLIASVLDLIQRGNPLLKYLHVIAVGLAVVAGLMALMVMAQGFMINSQGGSPQGTSFMISGGLLLGGVALIIADLSDFTITAAIIAGLLAIAGMVTGFLK